VKLEVETLQHGPRAVAAGRLLQGSSRAETQIGEGKFGVEFGLEMIEGAMKTTNGGMWDGGPFEETFD
jgi:hypothetical protein